MAPSSSKRKRRSSATPPSGQPRRNSCLARLSAPVEDKPNANYHDDCFSASASASKNSEKEEEEENEEEVSYGKVIVSSAPEDYKGKVVLTHEEEDATSVKEEDLFRDAAAADDDEEENPEALRSVEDAFRMDVDVEKESLINRRREKDRALALKAARRFAYFKEEEDLEEEDLEEEEEEEEEAGDDDDETSDEQEEERDMFDDQDGEDDWPGPFSTAMKLFRERDERLRAREEKGEETSNLGEETSKLGEEIVWKPTMKEGGFRAVAPSLRELVRKALAANAEHLESVQGIPGSLVKLVASLACGMGTMRYGFLSVQTRNSPTEIYVPDGSWAMEEKFEEIFRRCNTENLEILCLDICGRCLPDDVLSSTLARAPNSLPKLLSISLVGNYRLSDDGLMLLANSAPMLRSVNLSQCSAITSAGVTELLKKLEGVIKELILDDCQNVSGSAILPALKKLQKLQAISVSRLQGVNDKFVSKLISACSHLEELGLAGCLKVSSKSTKVIGERCLQLRNLDLRNIIKLNDNAIAYLASGSLSFQKLLLQCNNFSDEAVAAFIEASGASLVELSLNKLTKVSRHTALAISRRCHSTLRELDLSFCRSLTDDDVGLIVDSCFQLRVVKLFGCTQVTGLFLNGFSNPGVKIIGIRGILDHMGVPGVHGDW